MTIEIDGSQGEGGGQILRTALTLSMCTGQPVSLVNIRAKRKQPGLMRQHLTAVLAAAEISGAQVVGARAGASLLTFAPGKVRAGNYRFDIGTAGSCTLVLQTILPALLTLDADSTVVLTGGTHNTMSPPFHFLERAFLPLLTRMGAQADITLNRFGFYPAGGGEIRVNIKGGCRLQPMHLTGRGAEVNKYAESFFAGLPAHIAQRELAVVKDKLGWPDECLFLREIDRNQGSGNVLLLTLENEHVTEVFTGFAERGVPAETVANRVVKAWQTYLASTAVAGEHLTDQLLLPMALAGGGSFTASAWSQHAATNAEVIQRFLPVAIKAEKNADRLLSVTVTSL